MHQFNGGKNLNFDTNESTLKKHLSLLSVRSVYSSKRAKKNCLWVWIRWCIHQGCPKIHEASTTQIGGHTGELKLSVQAGNRSKTVKVVTRKSCKYRISGTKLLVKNLAFEATRNDLRELFGAFGKSKVYAYHENLMVVRVVLVLSTF